MGTFFSIVFAVLSFLIWLGANNQHREQTGFNLPSSNARKRIRRNARKKGISEADAHAEWVVNKRARLPKGSHAPVPRAPPARAQLPPPSPAPLALVVGVNDEPEQAFLIASPIQAEMSYKGQPYCLHSDYTVSGVLNGAQVRWKSVHSFRRWVDTRIASPVPIPTRPHDAPPTPPIEPPVDIPLESQPVRSSRSWAPVVTVATLVIAAGGGWIFMSRGYPSLGVDATRQDFEPGGSRPPQENSVSANIPRADEGSVKTENAASPPSQREMVSTKRAGNIRERPDRTSPISKTAQAGMNFYIFTKERDWVQVGVEKPWGWMHSSLLNKLEP